MVRGHLPTNLKWRGWGYNNGSHASGNMVRGRQQIGSVNHHFKIMHLISDANVKQSGTSSFRSIASSLVLAELATHQNPAASVMYIPWPVHG